MRFRVLVDRMMTGSFQSFRSPRQSDPLSPYPFVSVIEALSCFNIKGVEKGFTSEFKVWARGDRDLKLAFY